MTLCHVSSSSCLWNKCGPRRHDLTRQWKRKLRLLFGLTDASFVRIRFPAKHLSRTIVARRSEVERWTNFCPGHWSRKGGLFFITHGKITNGNILLRVVFMPLLPRRETRLLSTDPLRREKRSKQKGARAQIVARS